MQMLQKSAELWIKRLFLICYDACAVFVAAFFALWLRYEFAYRNIEKKYLDRLWKCLPLLIVSAILVFALFKLYSSLWAYAGAMEVFNVTVACVSEGILSIGIVGLVHHGVDTPLPRSFYILYGGILWILILLSRFAYRALRSFVDWRQYKNEQRKVLIVGAGDAGNALIKEIRNSRHLNMNIVGVIDDAQSKIGSYIHGIKILGDRNKIVDIAEKTGAKEIIIAIPSASPGELKELLDICKQTTCELKRLPGIYQFVNGDVSVSKLKNVDVNDLLGREPIKVDLTSILDYVSGKVIMVTGGGGSIGSELCRQIASHNPKQLVLVDIYENTTYDIQQELRNSFPRLNLVVLIASVRNTKRMDMIFEKYKPDIVYHAAAHKHVPLMEDSPNEAVKNNVLGTWKVVQAANRWKVKRFVLISTDKAVNPTNIMGATKRICEMIIQTYDKHSETEFVAVRFGNVLGSNGSVIPLFKKQIEAGGPVTVTHPDIIRYFMTIPEAVSLVLQAGAYAKGGEIFVLDMGEPVKILDLAKNLIRLSGHKPGDDIKIEFTGLRPGEKLYEEMLMDEEGLQDTENKLIHIGKPIDIDEDKFMKQLEELKSYVVEEPEDIRDWVRKIVATYHP
ncbi:MAG: polysaccharide biosynthesis protein [Lachnospiraceae bacterium]|nr:polysaccharide biosynthesis protein [Lachnospiraceae bacterium]